MKKAVVVLLIIAGIVAWFFWRARSPVPVADIAPDMAANPTSATISSASAARNNSSAAPAVVPATPVAALAQEVKPVATISPGTPTPAAGEVSSLPPLTVLDNARVSIHNYNALFGENPVGDNSEITAALMGKNPKQVNFIREDAGLRVNDQGEMIDAWGTPFFFHQLSGQVMEIRSAGEDKKMWTFDDQVTR